MITQKLSLSKYHWEVIVWYDVTQEDDSRLLQMLESLHSTYKEALESLSIIRDKDKGFIHTDILNRVSFICICRVSSSEELINSVAHEVKHLQSHVCNYYNIPEDGEEAAYLCGDTAMQMYKKFKMLL